MTSAYVLIAAIVILGGLIAVLGDRLGSKIGKARLTLFGLRPRQTAQLVTVLTGTLIALSTLGILFALSKSLRQGVFDLDRILKEKREVESELARVKQQRNQVERELSVARSEQTTVEGRLQEINQNFVRARSQLKTISNQARTLREDIKTLLAERQQLVRQKNDLSQQIARFQEQLKVKDRALSEQDQKIARQTEILQQRQTRLQELEKQQSLLQGKIDEQDRLIGQLDKSISDKDQSLKSKEEQLKELESQQAFLKREVEVLEDYYQTYQELRERRIAIVRGQVLSFAAVRIVDPNAVVGAIDRLLSQANRTAISATQPSNEEVRERVVKITKAQVEQLMAQIKDGRDYVVRILSAGNYVQGEKEVRVFADVALNQKIFEQNDIIATISVDSVDAKELTEAALQNRLDILLSASQFRARRSGIVGDIQVEDGRIKKILNFIEQLSQSKDVPDEIKAIASETAYTAGPLKLRLVALKDSKILFSTY
ncbi:MAG: DUF3084 domain-containing protein [Hydrococcus sp. C42_A2020_068]|uniref:DUF3084 domain-containing protein n=1 Tax=Pleurocapsa sp. PCC 7327 TaxID=118163 RepID=UPI00029FE684|nr:DUF3084 domain-containing protein [Pleurocapsa sp. PCC 7327]AFY77687.1 hypothetical protein Ple7327_2382 [Pleurocapsa sp. PCC 7327]MBF2019075.1 DUF3084 domain-containing protein [Hydrococcus sp. C42_A2020_068]